MRSSPFDALITPGDHVGLHPEPRQDAVVDAVQGMDGANYIDVMAANFPSTCPGWVIVYPRGNRRIPDTQPWRDLRHRVEEMVKATLVAAASEAFVASAERRAATSPLSVGDVLVISGTSVPAIEESLRRRLSRLCRNPRAGTAPGRSTAAWAVSPCPCTALRGSSPPVGTLQAVLSLLEIVYGQVRNEPWQPSHGDACIGPGGLPGLGRDWLRCRGARLPFPTRVSPRAVARSMRTSPSSLVRQA